MDVNLLQKQLVILILVAQELIALLYQMEEQHVNVQMAMEEIHHRQLDVTDMNVL